MTFFSLCTAVFAASDTSSQRDVPKNKLDDPEAPKLKSKVGLTYYLDSREYETLAVFSAADGLPFGLRLWGFTDMNGYQDHQNGRFRLDRYFSEYRVLLPLKSYGLFNRDGFGAIVEYNDFNGPSNSLVRFGPYYQHPLPLFGDRSGSLQWRIFPLETDAGGWQASVSYAIPLADRVSITGFADINFAEVGAHRWVVEPQLNLRLSRRFSAVVELRHNGFEQASGLLEGTGVAGGLRYSR